VTDGIFTIAAASVPWEKISSEATKIIGIPRKLFFCPLSSMTEYHREVIEQTFSIQHISTSASVFILTQQEHPKET
jgi:hypothetical protein